MGILIVLSERASKQERCGGVNCFKARFLDFNWITRLAFWSERSNKDEHTAHRNSIKSLMNALTKARNLLSKKLQSNGKSILLKALMNSSQPVTFVSRFLAFKQQLLATIKRFPEHPFLAEMF